MMAHQCSSWAGRAGYSFPIVRYVRTTPYVRHSCICKRKKDSLPVGVQTYRTVQYLYKFQPCTCLYGRPRTTQPTCDKRRQYAGGIRLARVFQKSGLLSIPQFLRLNFSSAGSAWQDCWSVEKDCKGIVAPQKCTVRYVITKRRKSKKPNAYIAIISLFTFDGLEWNRVVLLQPLRTG